MPASRRATVTLGIAVVVVAAIGAGAGVMMARRARETVGGSVHANGTSVGSFSFRPNDCASGQAFVPGFFGVDLRGEGGYSMRVLGTGDKARLWLYSQGGAHGSIAIDKPNCSRWDVGVDWAHVTVNRVKTVSGHVRVACRAGGGTVSTDVVFERCAL